MKRAVRVALVITLALVGTLIQTPAQAGHDSCGTADTKINNIHWGLIGGVDSVKVIGQIKCTATVDRIFGWQVVLWFCGATKPQANETYLQANCNPHTQVRSLGPVSAGTTVKNRAPTDADAPVTATGWYMGDMLFNVEDMHSSNQSRTYGWYWTPAVYCTSAPFHGCG